jgi:hypothetical protein
MYRQHLGSDKGIILYRSVHIACSPTITRDDWPGSRSVGDQRAVRQPQTSRKKNEMIHAAIATQQFTGQPECDTLDHDAQARDDSRGASDP